MYMATFQLKGLSNKQSTMAPKSKVTGKKGVKQQPTKPEAASSSSSTAIVAMGKNAAQEAMSQLKRLEKSGRSFPIQHYKALSTSAKRDFAAKLEVDKEASFLGDSRAGMGPRPNLKQGSSRLVLFVGRG